jgi:hypothetical protein
MNHVDLRYQTKPGMMDDVIPPLPNQTWDDGPQGSSSTKPNRDDGRRALRYQTKPGMMDDVPSATKPSLG